MPLTISKSKFKPKALHYFREIQKKGEEIIITDHNQPVVRMVAYKPDHEAVLRELRGSVKQYDNPLEPVSLDDWDLL
jgi:antitoxin (DNA-binding transcriptional repressor) of toxin-antitoxin stability system